MERAKGTQMVLPDIKNGFIINGVDSPNRWQTSIESCLIKTEEGEEKTAFLGTKCRAEWVSPEHIFVLPSHEFALSYTWDGPVVIRSGPGIYRLFRKKASAVQRYGASNIVGEIRAPMAKVQTYGVSDLISRLQSESQQPDNFIYMQVDWKVGENSYKLICPCRYINYSNDGLTDTTYVQPISGDVLIEYEGRFRLAYVSNYVTPDATQKTELILKDPISLFELKQYRSYRRRFIPSLAYGLLRLVTAPFAYFLMTDEYCRVINLDAECTFFTYSEN